MANHNIIVTIGFDAGNSSLSPNDPAVNENDTVTCEPTGGTINSITNDSTPDLFSTDTAQDGNGPNWIATIGSSAGSETYTINVTNSNGQRFDVDPQIQVRS